MLTEPEMAAILAKYPHIQRMRPGEAYRTLSNVGCFVPPEMGAALAIRAGIKPTDKPISFWRACYDTIRGLFP